MKLPDLAGQVFGRWTVLRSFVPDGGGQSLADVACECGTKRTVLTNSLRKGRSRSCGCYSREVAREQMRALVTTHGLSENPAEREAVEKAERDQIEKARREAELAALRPDVEKVAVYVSQIRALEPPEVGAQEIREFLYTAKVTLCAVAETLEEAVAEVTS